VAGHLRIANRFGPGPHNEEDILKVPEPDEERPLAWTAILADTPVHAKEGREVGTVHDVLGSEQKDIFHGIVVHQGLIGRNVFVPADQVGTITDRRLVISLSEDEVRELPPYEVEHSYTLGFTGLLRKHLGWVEDVGRPGQS